MSKDLLSSRAGDVRAFDVVSSSPGRAFICRSPALEAVFRDSSAVKRRWLVRLLFLFTESLAGSWSDSLLPVLMSVLKAAKLDVAVVGEAANSPSPQECFLDAKSKTDEL